MISRASESWGTYGEAGGGERESPEVYWIVCLGFLFMKKRLSHKTEVGRTSVGSILKAP